jgi:hypothetical protein
MLTGDEPYRRLLSLPLGRASWKALWEGYRKTSG